MQFYEKFIKAIVPHMFFYNKLQLSLTNFCPMFFKCQ